MASQAVDKCQSREGIDVALNDIKTFLGTAKEYQLLSPKEFYNQFELILTFDVKVPFLGCFGPVARKGMREKGTLLVASEWPCKRNQAGCVRQPAFP